MKLSLWLQLQADTNLSYKNELISNYNISICYKTFYSNITEQHALKNVNNGKEATVNRALDGSTYSG